MEVEIQNIDICLNKHFKRKVVNKKKLKYESISYIFLSSAISIIENQLRTSKNEINEIESNDDSCEINEINNNVESFDDSKYDYDDYDEFSDYDDYFNDNYDDLGDEIEFNLTYNFKMKFNRIKSNNKCLRNKKHKQKFKKLTHFRNNKKMEKYKENVLSNKPNPKINITGTQYSYHNYNNTYNEEEALRRAINESRNAGTSSGLTYQQILDLQTRELTPEDYELLLILDESVPKKTLKQNQISNFKTFILNALSDINVELCAVCMDMFQIGEELKKLKCNHIFHSECINNWLSSYSTTCPIDGLSLA